MLSLTKKNAMYTLQVLSISSAIAAITFGLINLNQQDQDFATLQSLGNFSAFMLFTISGMIFDAVKINKVRPERFVALMGLLLAAIFNICKLTHSSFTSEYPSLDTLGLGLTMGIFGLVRHDPKNPTLNLKLAVGRRNASAYFISALGFSVQIISALALKNAELTPMIAPLVLATISTVVFSDLHAILPAPQKRTTHAFAFLTTCFTLGAILLLGFGQVDFKILVSALIATFIGMHAFALHSLLHPIVTTAAAQADSYFFWHNQSSSKDSNPSPHMRPTYPDDSATPPVSTRSEPQPD